MPRIDDDQLDLLRQARDRAAKLVEDVRRQRDELETSRPSQDVPAGQIEQGRVAMANTLAPAERMLAAVESALLETEPDPE